MDALGILLPAQPPVITPTRSEAPVIQTGASTAEVPVKKEAAEARFDPQVAERRRAQAVQLAAQNIANVYVVSDQKFTIFKDAGGQYITRFTSLRDGRVTYIPEPNLLRLAGFSASQPPALEIEA